MHVYIDVTDTWNSSLHTGVQRVVVESARALVDSYGATLVRLDRGLGQYVRLGPEESNRLFSPDRTRPVPGRAGHRWLRRWGLMRPAAAAHDVFRRLLGPLRALAAPPNNLFTAQDSVLFTAEILGDRSRVRALRALTRRRRIRLVVAVHDLIPHTHPELSLLHPSDHRRYLSVLATAELLVPVSQTTFGELERWMLTCRLSRRPAMTPILPGFPEPQPWTDRHRGHLPLFSCIGTVETRKNQARLLDSLESLWAQGRRFEFVFAGARSRTSSPFEESFRAALSRGRPVRWLSPATEGELNALYRDSTATVYVSSLEGFGLPVVEALARGAPCIASATGAVGELASALGGCELVDPQDPSTWMQALCRFLDEPGHRDHLVASIRTDRFRTWTDYADDLVRVATLEAPTEDYR